MKKAGVIILTAAMTISAVCAGYSGVFAAEDNASAAYESKYTLSNPDADEITSKLYDYICDSFGNTILSGQQESTWMDSVDYEMNYIQRTQASFLPSEVLTLWEEILTVLFSGLKTGGQKAELLRSAGIPV